MPHRFDLDTASQARAPGEYAVTLTDAWNIGPVPNGGYQVAAACRAALTELGVADVLSVSSYFLGASAPGPATLHVEVAKRGRATSLAQVRLVQEARERLRALVLAGDLGELRGPELHRRGPPELPPPEACLRLDPDAPVSPRLMNEIELRLDPATAAFTRGERDPDAPLELRAWARFTDGRPVDALALALLSDVLPPTIFNALGITGWVPTLELTTQIRRRPAPGWIRLRVVTHHVSAGHFEEDGELWDSADELVALSRQRAVILGA
ncbi:MAG: thioesterase family protein [Myxococcales bacterium]|nr:thioesterase family protein [Myxococcales bacterium]MCB9570227.1 thioesterase family protein [Myxococcales bacterium]MCB9702850.1 thioesterase family protein [Myxococcales bacterium]